MMTAKIYKPAKTAMQSGKANTKLWVLEYLPENTKSADPIMGWTSSNDTKSQLKLRFNSSAEAEQYAKAHKIKYIILQPKKPSLHLQAYAANFL